MVGGTACSLVCYVVPAACALGLPRVAKVKAADGKVLAYHEALFPACSVSAAAALLLAIA